VSRLDPDRFIADAVAATGLDDFGGDSFREGLAVYCASAESEARLNDLGRATVPRAIESALTNRLRVIDYAKQHPEVAEERIESPWIVIGIFRAGTTLMSYLLETDERSRPLLRWEAGNSVPPSTGDHRNDPRVEPLREAAAFMDSINPRIKVVQSEEPDGPTECITVMGQDFKSVIWEALTNVPTYAEWLRAVDLTSTYDYHRRVLQVLQSGGVRGTWSLKAPQHAMALEALHAVYPDARLVLMHRDPVVLCASVCSLLTTLTSTFTDADHAAYIAEHWTQLLDDSINVINAFRAAHPDVQIHDVHYADLAQDTLGTMRGVYDAFGVELTAQAEAAMAAHVESHPKGRFGTHGYDLAEYGLDGDALRERFAGYVADYDVPLERPRQV
jgi:hypothetical protein